MAFHTPPPLLVTVAKAGKLYPALHAAERRLCPHELSFTSPVAVRKRVWLPPSLPASNLDVYLSFLEM